MTEGINDAGLEIVRHFEGCRLEPYVCSGGHATIGFGAIYAADGQRVTMLHPAITEECAEELLRRDVNISYRAVERLTQPYTEDLTRNQKSALASLVFNIGSGNFRASAVRSNIVRGEIENAGRQIWQWRRAGGRIMRGLVRRRAEETDLYFAV